MELSQTYIHTYNTYIHVLDEQTDIHRCIRRTDRVRESNRHRQTQTDTTEAAKKSIIIQTYRSMQTVKQTDKVT